MLKLPREMMLEVTSACNFNCPFCYCVWHEFPELAGKDLDTTAWEAIIAECASRGVDNLVFTGGEATLRRDIWHLLVFARSLLPNASIALFTNGSLMSAPRIALCRNHRIELATSLQGLRTYAIQTGTSRKFGSVLSFIARAAEMKWPVSVSITANRTNMHELADIVSAAVLSHARCIMVVALMLEGRARQHAEQALSKDEWETLKSQLNGIGNCGIPIVFSDEMLCECRQQPSKLYSLFGERKEKPCQAGTSFGVVGPSGFFRKCLHTVENMAWR